MKAFYLLFLQIVEYKWKQDPDLRHLKQPIRKKPHSHAHDNVRSNTVKFSLISV